MIDEMQLLAGMRSKLPAGALDTARAEQLFQAKFGKEHGATRTSRPVGPTWRAQGHYRWPALWGLVGLAVAGLTVAMVLGISEAPHPATVVRVPKSGGSTRAPDAAGVLHAAAREAAAISPVPEPAADQWIYTSVVQVSDGHRSTSDNWTQFDGVENAYMQNGKLVTHTVTYLHNGQQVPDTALADPVPAGTNPLAVYDGMPMSSYEALASLKQAPATLLNDVAQVVSRGARMPAPSQAPSPALAFKEFNFLAQLLWNASTVPTGAEANVFNALATLPGITLQQNQTDAAGQPAIAVGTTGANSKQLLFDPNSYRVLGIRWTTPAAQLCTPRTCSTAGATTASTTGTGTTAPINSGSQLTSTSVAYANVALVAEPGDH